MENADIADTAILPAVTPPATISELTITRSKLPFFQAAAMFSKKWLPGKSGIGTWLTVWKSWLAATNTIHSGMSSAIRLKISSAWVNVSRSGVRSIMPLPSPVMDAPLDEAELNEGERDDQQHQHDRLRGG